MKRISAGLCSFVLILAFGGLVWGQATAQISGTVRDQSGAVLPGVEITVTQTDTGVSRNTVSNETGSFVLPSLATGPYRLEAGLPGFRTFVQTGIVLQVNANPVINPTLEVGQVSEQVEVQANAAMVETRSAGVGQVIETQRILDLPLNGRNVTDLITLSGAAIQTGSSPGFGMKTGVNISVAGGIGDGVNYTLDGATHINPFDGTSMPLPFPDALQEFRVSTSTQDASSGGRSGAAVNVVMKSGTNAFHGDAFEFVRNDLFNATNWNAVIDPITHEKQHNSLKRNQFGGTLGGPIQKDKMFFFAGYQGTTIRETPSDSNIKVPTAAMLAGDFTAFNSADCNTGRAVTLKAPFVNNKIPVSQLSPAALKIASYLPKPIDECGTARSTGNINHENDLQIPVRIDYQRSAKQTLFGRYMLTRINVAVPHELAPDNILNSGGVGSHDMSNSLTLGSTYLISPTVVNSFRISGNRVSAIKPGAKIIGFKDVGINAYTYTPTYLTLTGPFSIGNGNFSANSFAYTTTFGVNDDVSIVKGSHQIAFGASFMRSIEWSVAQAWSGMPLTITSALTGSAMGDFFVGNVNQIRQAPPNPLNLNQNFWNAFVQDTWKVTPKFTMTFGVNWQPFFAMSFPQGDLYNFDLKKFYANQRSTVIPKAPPGFTYPGDPGFNGNSGIQSRYWNLDPRVGLAWDVSGDGKTAIRVGGGIGHDFIRQDLHLNTSSVAPFRLTVIRNSVNLDNPWAGFPGGNPFPFVFSKDNPQYGTYGSYLPVPSDMKTHVQYTWNFGIQRQVTPSLFVSGTYLGTHIIHVWNAIELNPAQFLGLGPCTLNTVNGPVSYPVCSTLNNIDARRILNLANPQASLGYITQYDDGGTQGYNGLIVDMRLRKGQALSLNGNYTWSHCIGLATISLLNPGANHIHQEYQNNGSTDRNMDVGDCGSDRRRLLNMTLVAKTPRFDNRTLRLLGSGWSLSTIYTERSGSPISLTGSGDIALSGFAGNGTTQRPNQILGNAYVDGFGDSHSFSYLNPNAFALPATGTYGNIGVGNLTGPSFWNWDEAIARTFEIREGQKLEFRAEAYNITNSLRRGNPGTSLGTLATFGLIRTSAGTQRIMQFSMKYVF